MNKNYEYGFANAQKESQEPKKGKVKKMFFQKSKFKKRKKLPKFLHLY